MTRDSVSRRSVLKGVGAAVAGAAVAGEASAAEGDYVVGVTGERGVAAARSRAESVKHVLDFGDIGMAVAGRFSEEALEALESNPNVRYVERDVEGRVLAETLPWGIDRVDAEVAHANGETGGDNSDGEGGADVAIVDTGIDSDHPDLDDNLGKGKHVVDCVPLSSRGGCPFGVGSNDNACNTKWDDDYDHGSHVAGTADAEDNSRDVIGVSTNATLHSVKVCDYCGSCSQSDTAQGLTWTADQGYDVANVSLGFSEQTQTLQDAVQYATNNGVFVAAAAGNDGPCTDCVGYPAAYSEVVAVSATSDDDSLADFSSTGPEVELAAPGEDVLSTTPAGTETFSGTSMASPHVAGAAAQLMDNGYTNSEARDQLNSTAEDIGLSSNAQGNGLVDVAASLGLDSSDDLGGGNSAPAVDSLSASEVETSDSDAEFDVDWSVSDSDGNLDAVDLTLTDDTDGETEDTASIGVSGDTASGTTRMVAAGDDGSGNSYTVEAVVTDSDGATDSATTTVSESEGTSGGNAPTVDSLSLAEDNSGGSPHANFDASWSVSDADGDLDTVDLTLTDLDDGETEDTASVDVSGSDASGTTDLKAKQEENSGHEYEVELVVTDSNGNTASGTATEVEDGS